jgi:hypothetical protein
LFAAHHLDASSSPALDTLQHGLAGETEGPHGLAHRQRVVGRFAVEARLELIGQTNAPGSAGRELLAGDDAVVEQAMDRRGSDAERGGGLPNCHEVAVGLRFFLEAGDLPLSA